MKKSSSPEFIVIVLVLLAFAIYSWLYPPFINHAPTDNTPLAEKVKSRLGVDLADLENSLALMPVVTGEEPSILTYSVPLKTDASAQGYLPNDIRAQSRVLALMDNDKAAEYYDFSRQTNGTYLIQWNTTFSTNGQHTLQVCLHLWDGKTVKVFGPKLTETVTNLIRFDPDISGMDRRKTIARIYGILQVTNADYKIDICTTNGVLQKSFVGRTDKGVIDEVWDLKTNTLIRKDDELDAKVYIKPVFSETNDSTKTNVSFTSNPYLFYLFR